MLVLYVMCLFILPNILKSCFNYFTLQNANILLSYIVKIGGPGLEFSALGGQCS